MDLFDGIVTASVAALSLSTSIRRWKVLEKEQK